MYNFESDYLEGCAPEIMEELIKTNSIQTSGYGLDDYCSQASSMIKKAIHNEDVDVHFIPGGTPCNILAIASCLRPHEAVIAAKTKNAPGAKTKILAGSKILRISTCSSKTIPSTCS